MIVKYSFSYWMDGHCEADRLEEYSSLKQAILELGQLAFHTANNGCVIIEQVYGAPEEIIKEIQEGIDNYVQVKKQEAYLQQVNSSIKELEKWLNSVNTQIEDKQKRLADLYDEREKLENKA